MAREELLRSAQPRHHVLWMASREAAALEVTADLWVPDPHFAVTWVPEGRYVTQGSSKGLLLCLEEKKLEKENKFSWTSCLAMPQPSHLTPDGSIGISGYKVLN